MWNYSHNCKILNLIFYMVSFMVMTTSYSQLQKEFTPRYSETIRGDFTMISNNVLSRDSINAYSGSGSNHDFNNNVFVDIDNDPTTFNSSSAFLENPAPDASCITIERVFLYWAAADKEYEVDILGIIHAGNGGSEVSWNYDDIKLMLPGSSEYGTTLTADEVIYRGRDDHTYNDPYICVKDITEMVQDLEDPFGSYQVANVKATEGQLLSHDLGITGTSGGWQMVFVLQSPIMPQKNITLFDGYAHISTTENNFDITFDGFQTVPNGNVKANMVIGALEGDRSLSQDQLLIFNTNDVWEPINTSMRQGDNFFNSSITKNGSDFINRIPASTNTLGYDAGLFQLENNANRVITNDQTSAMVRMTSNQETYGLYLLGMAVEVWEPALDRLDLFATASSESPVAGETIQVYLDVANTGNDNIRNLSFSTKIPDEMIFIGVESLPNEITYTFDTLTRVLEFTVADGYTDVTTSPYTIQYAVKIQEEAYFEDLANCSFESSSQTIAIFSGEINTTEQTANSSFTFDDCGIGNGDPTILSINLNDIKAPVFVEPLPVDMTVKCDGVPEAAILTAIDNCDSDPSVTFEETVTNDGNCETGYQITRTWTTTDDMGNSFTHTQIITVEPNVECSIDNLLVSKTITANGDGVNDYFKISGLEGCDYKYNVQIFNRWGNIVYESDDYTNEWGAHAPNNALGNSGMLPTGTYYYILGFGTPEVQPVNGYIYIGSN